MINLAFNDAEGFKKYLSSTKSDDFALDTTGMNVFDGLKFMVLSSAYFYQKYPNSKLKCRIKSDDIKSLIANFDIKNLEFV